MVYKLDRISRSQKDTLFLIEEVFNLYDVGFVSIRESFDTTTPFGKAMVGILSIFAQLERETILERTRLGRQKRAEDGLWQGGGNAPWVYDYIKGSGKGTGSLEINPERKMIFDLMVELYLKGYSFLQLEAVTGLDESFIRQVLLCKTNAGIITFKGNEYQGQHEPAIDMEVYNEIIATNKSRSSGITRGQYLLTGKIYCEHCGAKYRYQKNGQRIVCYCYSQQKSCPKTIKDPNCKNKRFDSFEIEDSVLENLFAMSLDQKYFDSSVSHTKIDVVEEIKKQIGKLSKQIENLISFISDGIAIEDTKIKIKNFESEREKLKEELKKHQTVKKKSNTAFDIIKNLSTTWNLMEFEDQKTIINLVIDKVTINNDRIGIYYKV